MINQSLLLAAGPAPFWFYPLLAVIGIVVLLHGIYVIKAKRSGLSWLKRQIWGVKEITGRWAVVNGIIRCVLGTLMILIAMIGPFMSGILSRLQAEAQDVDHQQQQDAAVDLTNQIANQNRQLREDL